MRRIVEPSHRYGDPDFDTRYMEWGLHDPRTQIEQAQSALRVVSSDYPLRILDLACGIGTHAIEWASQGHHVTAVDISEVFIARGRQLAADRGVSVDFRVEDIRTLPYRSQFDLVTWIESSVFDDQQMATAIRRSLVPGGAFLTDVRNPENPKYKQRAGNWRTWREKGNVFYLERHETDPSSGIRDDVWIEIDPAADVIREKRQSSRPVSLQDRTAMLRKAGFPDVQLHTLAADPYPGGPEPYWLWLLAR